MKTTVKVNGKELEWEDAPKGQYLTDVKIHVIWRDEKTGAQLRLMKYPKGGNWDRPHTHPEADKLEVGLSGEIEIADGTRITASGDDIIFTFVPKGKTHGASEGTKAIRETVVLQHYDGPPT